MKSSDGLFDQSEQLSRDLEIIFNSTQDAIFLLRVDDDNELRYVRNNTAHEKLTGYRSWELQNKTPVELFGPEIGLSMQANYRKCIASISPIIYEEELTTPAGNRHWLVSVTPVVVDEVVRYIVVSRNDITLRKIAEAQQQELFERSLLEREILRTTLMSIGDGMITTDKHGRVTSMNAIAQAISGWDEAEALGKLFGEIFPLTCEETRNKLEDPVVRVLQTGEMVQLVNHTLLGTKDGRLVPVADSVAPIKDHTDQIHGVIVVFRDVTKQKEHEQEILRLSQRDFLTGLYNRRFVHHQLQQLIGDFNRLPLAVLLGNVNGLGLINSVFGHHEGDHLLRKIADILTATCRPQDIVARWGGDEFLILLPKTDRESAETIVKSIEQAVEMDPAPIGNISIALGLAVIEGTAEKFEQTLKRAEDDMYRHKLLMSKSRRNALLDLMLSTLYEKSQETEQHARRLKEHSVVIGKQLGLSTAKLDELELLAILHDIGKIGVDATILNKPDVLSLDEWREIKKHPEIGYRIASNIPELAAVAEYILHHHERWDGKGYPAGLAGEDIPLLCRILALADAFDAMTTDRPYRRALSEQRALAEIKRNAGTQFDPKLADMFIKTIEDDGISQKKDGAAM